MHFDEIIIRFLHSFKYELVLLITNNIFIHIRSHCFEGTYLLFFKLCCSIVLKRYSLPSARLLITYKEFSKTTFGYPRQ